MIRSEFPPPSFGYASRRRSCGAGLFLEPRSALLQRTAVVIAQVLQFIDRYTILDHAGRLDWGIPFMQAARFGGPVSVAVLRSCG